MFPFKDTAPLVINSLASLLLDAAPTDITISTMLISTLTSFISCSSNKSAISCFVKSSNLLLNKLCANFSALSYSSFPCKNVIISRANALCASLNSGCSLFFLSYSSISSLERNVYIFK